MSAHTDLVTPLILDANSTLGSVAAVVQQIARAAEHTGSRPSEWVLLRATRGFAVSWYLLRFNDLVEATTEPVDSGRSIGDAVALQQQQSVPSVQLGQEESRSGPLVVLAGTRVFGLVPPAMRSAQAPQPPVPRGTRGRAAPATQPPAPDAAGALPSDELAAMRLDAAAYVDAPRNVLQEQPFTMEIGLADTPVPNLIGGQVSINFKEGEARVTLDVRLQCEGFVCHQGADHALVIPRADPFGPRLKLTLESIALPSGVPEELRAIHVTFATAGMVCGVATWRIVVQREAAPVAPPVEAPSRVAIDPEAPPIDLTLISAWKDDTEASQTLCWRYETPHAIEKPDGKMTRSSPELAALPLGLVDELAQGDGLEGIELLMGGLAARIATEIPAGVWEVLRSVTDAVHAARGPAAVPTVLLLTQETRVPWELALLPDELFPPAAGAPEPRVIGTEFTVSRWVLDDGLPLPPHQIDARDVVAVYGDYSGTGQAQLPFAKKEAEYLEEKREAFSFTADRSTILNILTNKSPTPGGTALAPKILHFAGHGEAARSGAPTSFIVLNDGSNLSSTLFLNSATLKQNRPLVFLNACQLGAAVRSLGQPGGFAVVFVRGKCAAVVAPLWSVNDQVAFDVATHFYDAVLSAKQSPAEALRQARQPRFADVTLTDDATGETVTRRTATRLAYLFYGHPCLTLA